MNRTVSVTFYYDFNLKKYNLNFDLNKKANSDQNESSNETQLRHENERLRLAVGQAMTNARKFEDEIQALKTANLRLTAAVQESQSNVEEWKKQMMFYKEECSRLKNSPNHPNSGNNLIKKIYLKNKILYLFEKN